MQNTISLYTNTSNFYYNVADSIIRVSPNSNVQHWTEMPTTGSHSPEGREYHAACLIAGTGSSQLLVVGGLARNGVLQDSWVLDLESFLWKEVGYRSTGFLYIQEAGAHERVKREGASYSAYAGGTSFQPS